MQDLVLLMDPPRDGSDISLKAGNMILNRFCIDEEASFESSGIFYLNELEVDYSRTGPYTQKAKGTGYRRDHITYAFICLLVFYLR